MQQTTRQRERVYPEDTHAAIGDLANGPLARAEVLDESASGIGLRLIHGTDVQIGDRVRVVRRHSDLVRHARVVRLNSEGADHDGRPLVGCRWVSDRERANSISRLAFGRRH